MSDTPDTKEDKSSEPAPELGEEQLDSVSGGILPGGCIPKPVPWPICWPDPIEPYEEGKITQ